MSVLLLAFLQAGLVFFLVLRWIARRNGGWRRTWWLLKQEARLTWRAVLDPVRDYRRYRAGVRVLTGLLTDPATLALARAALDDVDQRLAGTGAFAYAVWIRQEDDRDSGGDSGVVLVRVAARSLPPPTGFWHPAGEGCWGAFTADVPWRAAPRADADPPGHRPERPLAPLGLDCDGLLLIDLNAGPGIMSVYGDARVCVTFAQATAAFLDLQPDAARVIVTRGLWPEGPALNDVIDSLTGDPLAPDRPVVVVCREPGPAETARLAELVTEGRTLALVLGPVPGHRWDAQLDPGGRLTAPGLHLFTESAPLASAVAEAIRDGASIRPRGPRPPAPGATGAAPKAPGHPVPAASQTTRRISPGDGTTTTEDIPPPFAGPRPVGSASAPIAGSTQAAGGMPRGGGASESVPAAFAGSHPVGPGSAPAGGSARVTGSVPYGVGASGGASAAFAEPLPGGPDPASARAAGNVRPGGGASGDVPASSVGSYPVGPGSAASGGPARAAEGVPRGGGASGDIPSPFAEPPAEPSAGRPAGGPADRTGAPVGEARRRTASDADLFAEPEPGAEPGPGVAPAPDLGAGVSSRPASDSDAPAR